MIWQVKTKARTKTRNSNKYAKKNLTAKKNRLEKSLCIAANKDTITIGRMVNCQLTNEMKQHAVIAVIHANIMMLRLHIFSKSLSHLCTEFGRNWKPLAEMCHLQQSAKTHSITTQDTTICTVSAEHYWCETQNVQESHYQRFKCPREYQ